MQAWGDVDFHDPRLKVLVQDDIKAEKLMNRVFSLEVSLNQNVYVRISTTQKRQSVRRLLLNLGRSLQTTCVLPNDGLNHEIGNILPYFLRIDVLLLQVEPKGFQAPRERRSKIDIACA